MKNDEDKFDDWGCTLGKFTRRWSKWAGKLRIHIGGCRKTKMLEGLTTGRSKKIWNQSCNKTKNEEKNAEKMKKKCRKDEKKT